MILRWHRYKNNGRHQKKIKKHQTTRCTKPAQAQKKKQNFQQLSRSGPIGAGNFVFFWCVFLVPVDVYSTSILFFGACAGLVTLTSQSIVKHQQKLKNTKPLDAPNLHRHKKKTNPNFPAPIQKWAHSCWKVCFLFLVPVDVSSTSTLFVLCFLVPLQVWWLWLHKTLASTKKTKNTKPAQAPKKQKIQQLPRSGPIVAGKFLCFFDACPCFLHFHFVFFSACAGLVTLASQNVFFPKI